MTITIDIDLATLDRLIASAGATAERIVADGVRYGIYQELGTERQGYAQPFMSPAVEDARAGFMQAAAQVITNAQAEDVVEKAARDVERGAKQRAPVDTGALKSSIHVEPK